MKMSSCARVSFRIVFGERGGSEGPSARATILPEPPQRRSGAAWSTTIRLPRRVDRRGVGLFACALVVAAVLGSALGIYAEREERVVVPRAGRAAPLDRSGR